MLGNCHPGLTNVHGMTCSKALHCMVIGKLPSIGNEVLVPKELFFHVIVGEDDKPLH